MITLAVTESRLVPSAPRLSRIMSKHLHQVNHEAQWYGTDLPIPIPQAGSHYIMKFRMDETSLWLPWAPPQYTPIALTKASIMHTLLPNWLLAGNIKIYNWGENMTVIYFVRMHDVMWCKQGNWWSGEKKKQHNEIAHYLRSMTIFEGTSMFPTT